MTAKKQANTTNVTKANINKVLGLPEAEQADTPPLPNVPEAIAALPFPGYKPEGAKKAKMKKVDTAQEEDAIVELKSDKVKRKPRHKTALSELNKVIKAAREVLDKIERNAVRLSEAKTFDGIDAPDDKMAMGRTYFQHSFLIPLESTIDELYQANFARVQDKSFKKVS